MRDAGTIAPAALSPIAPLDQIFQEFSDYLRRERGLAPKSIIRHLPVINRFLREVCPAGADDRPWDRQSAGLLIRQSIAEEDCRNPFSHQAGIFEARIDRGPRKKIESPPPR